MKNQLYELNNAQLAAIEKIYVFGDIHGDYFPFTKYVESIDLKSNLVIFLGDYADRGGYGIESIQAINNLITLYPDHVIALKGNHEDYIGNGLPCFAPCHLIDEVIIKIGDWETYYHSKFIPFLNKLYLSVLIPGQFLFVHGGISSRITSLDDLKFPAEEIARDILWSDPFEKIPDMPQDDELESQRGSGILFSKTITENVLALCGVKKLIRSHQPQLAKDGIFYNHDNKVVTVNSTSVYHTKPIVLCIDPACDYEITAEFI